MKSFLEWIKPMYRKRNPATSQRIMLVLISNTKAKRIMKVLYKLIAKASALPALEILSFL